MAQKEGNITPPNWPSKPDYTKPLPTSNDAGKIPPRTEVGKFNGLPSSTGPRPMKIEGA